ETWPRLSRKRRSASLTSRWVRMNERSPPRITWPSRSMPSVRLRENEPTPAIAITPSAMQATKMRKPCSPPRNSRSAKRSGLNGVGMVGEAMVMRALASCLGCVTAQDEMDRQKQDQRQAGDHAGDPDVGMNPGLRDGVARSEHIVDVDRRQPRIGIGRRH